MLNGMLSGMFVMGMVLVFLGGMVLCLSDEKPSKSQKLIISIAIALMVAPILVCILKQLCS